MAKYEKETKFYWLQLKEDFFEEDAIEWLEEQPEGQKYSLFYLKLCLKSLKTNGILIRNVGQMLVPYDNAKLAKLTNTDINTVIVAMELLKGIGLIQILENGEIYINQLENMIGSQSKGALKKQQQRRLKQQLLIEGGQEGDICPPKIEIEIKKESEKDINIKKEIEPYFANADINNLFLEFIEVRKKLKAVNSDRAIKTLINKLNKYDDDTKYQMIENSIVNSWKDVYEPKQPKQSTYKRVEKMPEYLTVDYEVNEATPEEIAELESKLSFEQRKEALQEKLKSKYGKNK